MWTHAHAVIFAVDRMHPVARLSFCPISLMAMMRRYLTLCQPAEAVTMYWFAFASLCHSLHMALLWWFVSLLAFRDDLYSYCYCNRHSPHSLQWLPPIWYYKSVRMIDLHVRNKWRRTWKEWSESRLRKGVTYFSNLLVLAERRPFGCCFVCLMAVNLLRRQQSDDRGGNGPSSYGSFRYATEWNKFKSNKCKLNAIKSICLL